jgi:hypothetical protein
MTADQGTSPSGESQPSAPQPSESRSSESRPFYGVTELAGPLYSVARTFRWIALAGMAFATGVFCQAIFNLQATPAGDDSATTWWVMLASAVAFFAAFFRLLVTARNLAVGDPAAPRQAFRACYWMYLGFPLLTIVGWICKRKLDEHFSQDQ